jgi:phosphonate transport system permease protein
VTRPVLVPVRPRVGRRAVLTGLMATALAVSVVAVAGEQIATSGGGATAWGLLASALRPDLSPAFLLTVAEATALTAAYAVAAMSVAVLLGIPGALLVSGVLTERPAIRAVTVFGTRGVFAGLRAVHELVWALLLLTVLGLNPVTGVLAIAIPYAASIARVLGDRLLDVPQPPLDALRAAGASPTQLLLHGRLPLAAPHLVAYLAYRVECAVRAAAVLSFIGLGGIGFRVEIALADLRFEQVWTLLAALVLLVVAVDRASARVRARYVA